MIQPIQRDTNRSDTERCRLYNVGEGANPVIGAGGTNHEMLMRVGKTQCEKKFVSDQLAHRISMVSKLA